ncbi:hypothetical protein MAR_036005 [Mya arenaria]|uniref:Transposase n=1 Tax=Mya arenaria TaxID=6604 RepID=A0ABY7EPQ5_MYAAR|nr:hypothetical protein MAR_036005 [Mya arenaria]
MDKHVPWDACRVHVTYRRDAPEVAWLDGANFMVVETWVWFVLHAVAEDRSARTASVRGIERLRVHHGVG